MNWQAALGGFSLVLAMGLWVGLSALCGEGVFRLTKSPTAAMLVMGVIALGGFVGAVAGLSAR